LNGQHWSKNFFLANAVTLCHIGEDGWPAEKTLFRQSATAFKHISAFLYAYLDVLIDGS
jgi:hypothetical protein